MEKSHKTWINRSTGLERDNNLRAIVLMIVLLLLLFGCSGCASKAGKSADSESEFFAQLDQKIPRLMERYDVPGVSIAVIKEGQMVWSNVYGYADRERDQKMTMDAVYRVESISKSVTAWGVMQLVQSGSIELDDAVSEYLGDWTLPDSGYPPEEITIRRLLSSSAGLDLGTYGDEYPPDGVIPSLEDTLTQELKMVYDPGSDFLYSNAGFHLLERVVEEVSGQDFAEYMADAVLIPLGMEGARYDWQESLRPYIPTGTDLEGAAVPLYVYPALSSGGLFATLPDVVQFAQAGLVDKYAMQQNVLSQESIRQIHTSQINTSGIYSVVSDGYGFGHFVETLSTGQTAVWHGGQGHGWMTHFHLLPERGDGIVILTNSQRSWPMIGQILRFWTDWMGVGSVKMSRITYGITIMQILIGLVVLFVVWLAVRLVRGLLQGTRRFSPFSKEEIKLRLLLAGFGSMGILVLVWCDSQPYLMITSIFPGISEQGGTALMVLFVVLVISAMFPKKKM